MKRLLRYAAAGAAGGLLAIAVYLAGGLERVELALADMRFASAADPSRWPGEVVVVYIDQKSLAQVNWPWPWPRPIYGEIATYLKECGAKAVLLDFVFTERREADDDFARFLQEAKIVHIGTPSGEEGADWPQDDEGFARYAVPAEGAEHLPRLTSLTPPAPAIRDAGAAVLVETRADADNVVRRYRPLATYRGRAIPSLPLAAYLAIRPGKVSAGPGELRIGDLPVPLDEEGTAILSPYGVEPFHPFSFHVLATWAGEREMGAAKHFKDKVVLIGTSETGLKDIRATALDRARPGVDIHAHFLANLLNGDMKRRAGRFAGAMWTLTFSAALGALGAMRLRWFLPVAAFVTAGSVAWNFAMFTAGIWGDLAPSLLAAILAVASVSIYNYLGEGRQRRRVKRAFQQYVAPAVVDKILDRVDALNLAGERKVLTVFFMDFEGFTSASEKLDPAALVALLNQYHNEAVEEIFAEEGTLDKFIGDSVMAFWGDPVDQPDHAARACRAAVRIQARLRAMAERMRQEGGVQFRARIGINTGLVTAGNMGGHHQFNYTVIGDEVNLASRLEGVNKEFGTGILISERTREMAGGALETREIGSVVVKGRRAAVRVHEVLGLRGEVAPDRRFAEALASWRARKWDDAEAGFAALKGDGAAEAYLELCRRYRAAPPPDGWEGEFVMEKK